MLGDRWSRIEEIFHAALECPLPERDAYLVHACGDDRTLRSEVESLLANDGDGVHLLTIGLVPFAVTLVASHFGGDNSAHHNSCELTFSAGFAAGKTLPALQRSQTQVWRRVSN